MLEHLDGGCVVEGSVDALELEVLPVFVYGEVCCDTSEEPFSYGPLFLCAFLFLFHSLPCMRWCAVGDIGVISVGLNFLDPRQVCEMVVLVLPYDFS